MTGFSADWLALREPFDHAARSASAAGLDLRGMARRLRGADAVLGVLDLACGTGANLRELAPRLGGAQRWLLADHDASLLAALPDAIGAWASARGFTWRAEGAGLHVSGPDWAAEAHPLHIDLALALHTAPFAQARLVTASALLDLVSAPWLDNLLTHVAAARPGVLFALNVDGRVSWDPALPGDADIDRLFTAHQHRDKGFGVALGGEAVRVLAQRLASIGYGATQVRSDWRIDARGGPGAIAMIRAMVEGAGGAALEQDATARALVEGWMAQRLALADRSRLGVGHLDLLALP